MIEEVVGFDTEKPKVLSTTGSVGTGASNRADDVRLVQALLNNVSPSDGGPSTPLVIDGRVGPLTIAAITKYQKKKIGVADGRVDARNRTIRHLVTDLINSGGTLPAIPGLRDATPEEIAGPATAFGFPAEKVQPLSAQPVTTRSSLVGARGDTGFGVPFTPAGWTIDNSVGSIDISIKDTGAYVGKMTIFQDAHPDVRFELLVAGGFKSVSKGMPVGIDIALPSMAATRGKVIRGLAGFGPISKFSFLGVCGIAFAGFSAVGGANLFLIQFQWNPVGPPGSCMGFALMAGTQIGIGGFGAGAGPGIATPVS